MANLGFGGIEDMIAQALSQRMESLGGLGGLGGIRLGVGTPQGNLSERLGPISSLLDLLFQIQNQRLKIGGQLGSLRGLARGLGSGGAFTGLTLRGVL